MNVTRIAILGVAAIAAGAAALLVRGMLGGGTPETQASLPPPAVTVEVLVAANELPPGKVLTPDSVRWEAWPQVSVTDAFVTRQTQPDLNAAISGLVVRAPLVPGQPITPANSVRSDSASFMSANLMAGKRAVSIELSPETGAGGFILPNDRVDVILTRQLSQGGVSTQAYSETILNDVRVLAIDQTAQQAQDQQTAVGRTATLELTSAQAELLAQSDAMGSLSLSLRALGDEAGPVVDNSTARRATGAFVTVFRYGVMRNASIANEGMPQ